MGRCFLENRAIIFSLTFGSSVFLDSTITTFDFGFGICSMTTKRMMIKKGRNKAKRSQTSMSLIYEVGGSFDVTELLSVYITSMTVTGTLVLKCSLLK
jgi:hypothetical protein